MGAKRDFLVVFDDGSEYRIKSLGVLGILHKYKQQGCIVYANPPIKLPLEYCDGCERKFSDMDYDEVSIATDTSLNKKLGHPGRVCIDCVYWQLSQLGCFIPPAIQKRLTSGFKPINLI